jgi:hypothetical protein
LENDNVDTTRNWKLFLPLIFSIVLALQYGSDEEAYDKQRLASVANSCHQLNGFFLLRLSDPPLPPFEPIYLICLPTFPRAEPRNMSKGGTVG